MGNHRVTPLDRFLPQKRDDSNGVRTWISRGLDTDYDSTRILLGEQTPGTGYEGIIDQVLRLREGWVFSGRLRGPVVGSHDTYT